MSCGLQLYVSISTSFGIFLPQSNNFRDGFDQSIAISWVNTDGSIFFIEMQGQEIILARICLC